MSIQVLRFKTEYRATPQGTVAKDWVEIAPSGTGYERTRTWHPVERLRPPEGLDERDRNADTHVAMQARWATIGPKYDAWKNGQEIPDGGTPLAAWPGVTSDQTGYLAKMGVKTVEDVAELPADTAASLPIPNARRLPELAAKFLEGADVAAKDQELADMKERMKALEALLETQAPAPAPAKRGRKPVVKSEAA